MRFKQNVGWLLVAMSIPTLFLTVWCRAQSLGQTPAKPDLAAILREIQDYSVEGMDRRLGPDYAFYHRHSNEENFPEVWMRPSKQEESGRRYQIGGPQNDLVNDASNYAVWRAGGFIPPGQAQRLARPAKTSGVTH